MWDWRPVSSSVRIGPQLAPEHLPNPVLLTHSRGYPARAIAQTLVWFPLLRLCDTPSFPIDRQPGLPVNPDNPPSHLRRFLQSTLVKVSLVQSDVTPCRFRQIVNRDYCQSWRTFQGVLGKPLHNLDVSRLSQGCVTPIVADRSSARTIMNPDTLGGLPLKAWHHRVRFPFRRGSWCTSFPTPYQPGLLSLC